jgi:UDP-N-acetylmuramyl pentapeptide phosphotransferase/UDP-N-acetylglucosamine-1-phosphate transferase
MAHPNARSSHAAPTPQGAGVVVVPVALVGAAIGRGFDGSALPDERHLLAVAAAAVGLMLVGYFDDRNPLPPIAKLAAQCIAGLALILTLPADVRILPGMPISIERAAELVAIVWFVNAFNFMDGIDGISAAETASITLGIIVLAALRSVPTALGLPSAALLGATMGFVPWNAPPARVFLGDAGSQPMGFILAALLLHVAGAGSLAAALILPLYYLGDAALTVIMRIARKERVWEAHRGHFYQRAARAMSVRRVLDRLVALNMLLLAIAATVAVFGTPQVIAEGSILAVLLVGLTLWAFRRARGQN